MTCYAFIALSVRFFRSMCRLYGLQATHPTKAACELLDAQNEWHVQKQRLAASRYTYARDLLDLQRAMAWMECTKTDEQKRAWLQGLQKRTHSDDVHTLGKRPQ